MMREYWDNLTQRERWMLGLGASFVFILLFYWLLWQPLQVAEQATLQRRITQQSLLNWVQSAKLRLLQLRQAGYMLPTDKDASILVGVEKSLDSQHIGNYVKQVQQLDDKRLALDMANVPFDKLIAWLQLLQRQSGVYVVSLNARKATVGLVNAKLVLMAS